VKALLRVDDKKELSQNMEKFKIAKDIDKEYYNNYLIAKKAGVNLLAYRCDISSKKIFIDKKLKIIDD
jgi:sugar fermentation stimulation protein A